LYNCQSVPDLHDIGRLIVLWTYLTIKTVKLSAGQRSNATLGRILFKVIWFDCVSQKKKNVHVYQVSIFSATVYRKLVKFQ